eukprot:Awhi_evm1s8638
MESILSGHGFQGNSSIIRGVNRSEGPLVARSDFLAYCILAARNSICICICICICIGICTGTGIGIGIGIGTGIGIGIGSIWGVSGIDVGICI